MKKTVIEFYNDYDAYVLPDDLPRAFTLLQLLKFAEDYAEHVRTPCSARDNPPCGAGKMWCHQCCEYHEVSKVSPSGKGDGLRP